MLCSILVTVDHILQTLHRIFCLMTFTIYHIIYCICTIFTSSLGALELQGLQEFGACQKEGKLPVPTPSPTPKIVIAVVEALVSSFQVLCRVAIFYFVIRLGFLGLQTGSVHGLLMVCGPLKARIYQEWHSPRRQPLSYSPWRPPNMLLRSTTYTEMPANSWPENRRRR